MSVISYPIPAYQNVPIEPQWYEPSQFFISAITRGWMTTVTTTVNHNYVVGQQVRLVIPPTFGIRQLNEQIAYVYSIPSPTQVVITINSNSYDPFVSSPATTQPQIMAIGDVNTGALNRSPFYEHPFIPGSFINISPALSL
jgi:hypothetical protein